LKCRIVEKNVVIIIVKEYYFINKTNNEKSSNYRVRGSYTAGKFH
jgi:hypothetical protein